MRAVPRPGIDINSATTPVATASRTADVPAMAPSTSRGNGGSRKRRAVAVTAMVDGPGVPITATASSTSVKKGRHGAAKYMGPVMVIEVTSLA